MAAKKKNTGSGLISTGRVAENRRARHEYAISETIEAGIVLHGTEVKSLRQGRANLQEAYAGGKDGDLYLFNCHIPNTATPSISTMRPAARASCWFTSGRWRACWARSAARA